MLSRAVDLVDTWDTCRAGTTGFATVSAGAWFFARNSPDFFRRFLRCQQLLKLEIVKPLACETGGEMGSQDVKQKNFSPL